VFADIPGLIAGAAQGAGLGHDFLRHIERTRLLIHLIDASAEDVLADLQVVQRELTAYGHGLDQRPRLVVLNKIELLDPAALETALEVVRQQVKSQGEQPVLAISAAASKNLPELLAAVWQQLGVA
jgi:GTP-binding protein